MILKKLFDEENQVKIIFAGAIAILLAILIPMFVIGHYNFPCVDDLSLAYDAKNVWLESHSVLKVFRAQIDFSIHFWNNWQGTFIVSWFTSSLLGIFGESAYYIGTYLCLGGFVISELFLFMVILRKKLGADFYRAAIISIGVICMQLLRTTVPVEAFYWFCGATVYTIPYSEAVALTALFILFFDTSRKKWQKILLFTAILLLTVMVSGGTYVALIVMLLIYLFATAWYWYRKNPLKWFITGGFALYLTGFLLNVLAPGNQKKLVAANATKMNPLEAILISLKEAVFYILENACPPYWILAFLFLPLFIVIVRKKKFKYPFPVLVTLISFGVFAAQMTPTIYTLGILGAGRVLNNYRWTFCIWLYGNELYWVGWIIRKIDSKNREKKKERKISFLLAAWIIGGILLCYTLFLWGGDTLTAVSAILSLRRHEAQTYYAEYQDRLAILQDDSIKEAHLEPYSYYPYLLYFGDIADDPDNWVNQTVAHYYGKELVVLDY